MASLKEYQSLSAPPSVSSEQWQKYALKKMSSGYLLIISGTSNRARFYKGNGALEVCSFKIAQRLLRQGYLEEVGPHITGTIFQLSENHTAHVGLTQITQSKMGAVQVIEDDDFEDDVETVAYELEDALSDEALDNEDPNSANI